MTKKIGLSIAAAALLASTNVSAADNLSQAFTNATMKGKATIYYQSIDGEKKDQFSKSASLGDAALEIGLTTEKYNGVQLDMNYVMINTLGLENDQVSGTIQKADANNGDSDGALNDSYFSVFNISKDITENNNLKVGYQELKTPLLGSDYWAVVPNTFNASVLTNKSVDKLAVTVAYVSQERKRTDGEYVAAAGYDTDSNPATGDINGRDYTNGAWAVGLNYTGIEGTPINFWTYDVNQLSTANYVDVNTKVAGLAIAAQYGVITPNSDNFKGVDATSALGLKVGYKADAFGASFAYTSVGGDSTTGSGNFAKFSDGGNKTPLYTVGVASDGDIVGATDTTSMKVIVDTNTLAAGLNLALHYTTSTHGDNSSAKKTHWKDGSVIDTSTSTEIIAKYGISENTKLFAMFANYNHTKGAFASNNAGDANSFARVWLRYGF